jgi:hypothetical protein
MKKLVGFNIDEKLHDKIKILSVEIKKDMQDIVNDKLWELFDNAGKEKETK